MARSNSKSTSSGGLGLLTVLQLIFIVLKLTGLISWSWWCVLIPTFVGLGCTLIGLLVVLIVAVVSAKGD